MVSVFEESELLLEDARKELLKVDYCLEAYKELDSYMEIFEAKNKDIQQQALVNAKAEEASGEHLNSALDSIINAIKKLIERIKVFFMERSMTKEMRKAYEVYKQALLKDPSLKNKKITVVDVQKFKDEYDSINEQLDHAQDKVRRGIPVDLGPLTNLVNQYGAKIKSISTAAAMSVGMDAAIKMAEGNIEFAKVAYNKLITDKNFAEKIKEELGNHQYKKFTHKMKKYSQETSILRLRAKHNENAAKSLEDAIKQTINQYRDGIKSVMNIVGVMGDKNKETDKYGNPKTSTVGYLWRNRKDIKDDVKTVAKNLGPTALRMLGNKDAKELGMKGAKMAMNASKEKKLARKQAEKEDKFKQKHNDTQHQSLMSFATGKNDENSKVGQALNNVKLKK